MPLFVKICGLARREDAVAAAELRPDALGFILWPGSKRAVTAEQVGAWADALPPDIPRVGVFVDATPGDVARAMAAGRLQVAQLHGRLDPAQYAAAAPRRWRVAYAGKDDPAEAAGWSVDAVVLDTYSPTSPGGTGRVGDWEASRAFAAACGQRVLLAGGLHPANVREAVLAVRPWGVDVSSGVEERPGVKDLAKVRDFIAQCRSL